MKVKDLVKRLEKLDPDAKVLTGDEVWDGEERRLAYRDAIEITTAAGYKGNAVVLWPMGEVVGLASHFSEMQVLAEEV